MDVRAGLAYRRDILQPLWAEVVMDNDDLALRVTELTAQVAELVRVGNQLARSVGHDMGCPKISPALPCTCGEGAKQAQALDDWDHLVERLNRE